MSGGDPATDDDRPTGTGRAAPPPEPPEEPAVCDYCGDRFADGHLLALHHGLAHGDRLMDGERAAYREARSEEQDRLRLFRLKALGWLLVIYFGFVFVYAFVL